jgi:hypothetical protein
VCDRVCCFFVCVCAFVFECVLHPHPTAQPSSFRYLSAHLLSIPCNTMLAGCPISLAVTFFESIHTKFFFSVFHPSTRALPCRSIIRPPFFRILSLFATTMMDGWADSLATELFSLVTHETDSLSVSLTLSHTARRRHWQPRRHQARGARPRTARDHSSGRPADPHLPR